MTLAVHHLNCGTGCPVGGKLVNRSPARIVCHCLLVETAAGLVLVDTGLSATDLAAPFHNLGPMALLLRTRNDPAETAVERVKALGFDPRELRHIIPTHLDLDHAGGLRDFPWATVHVHRTEHHAAMQPASRREQHRYRPNHWAHHPNWQLYDTEGESWFGFRAVRPLLDSITDILLVPLAGHTRGHCAVAVQTASGWLLHAGDAYYDRRQIAAKPRCSPGFTAFQWLAHEDHGAARANLLRLRELRASHGDRIAIFSSHDPAEFEELSGERVG